MNGGQDMGGVMGFGPIDAKLDEPVFHAEWERKVLALTLGMGATGAWNIDMSRHARENIDPAKYLTLSYYQIWLEALEKLLLQSGLCEPQEILTGNSIQPAAPIKQKLSAANVEKTLAQVNPYLRTTKSEAKYQVGERVKTRNINPTGHTRLARYLRSRHGEIVHIHGPHVFPDANSSGKGECPQWLYTIRFDAIELWGEEARKGDFVHADLWQSYLEPYPVLKDGTDL